MRVLLVRCTNGIVGWRLSAIRSTGTTNARCLNDGFLVTAQLVLDSQVIDFMQAIAAHSVQLRGAVQSVYQVDLPQ